MKNIYILFVKQSENKMISYLGHFSFQSGCIISSGICSYFNFLMNVEVGSGEAQTAFKQ